MEKRESVSRSESETGSEMLLILLLLSPSSSSFRLQKLRLDIWNPLLQYLDLRAGLDESRAGQGVCGRRLLFLDDLDLLHPNQVYNEVLCLK